MIPKSRLIILLILILAVVLATVSYQLQRSGQKTDSPDSLKENPQPVENSDDASRTNLASYQWELQVQDNSLILRPTTSLPNVNGIAVEVTVSPALSEIPEQPDILTFASGNAVWSPVINKVTNDSANNTSTISYAGLLMNGESVVLDPSAALTVQLPTVGLTADSLSIMSGSVEVSQAADDTAKYGTVVKNTP